MINEIVTIQKSELSFFVAAADDDEVFASITLVVCSNFCCCSIIESFSGLNNSGADFEVESSIKENFCSIVDKEGTLILANLWLFKLSY